MITYQLIGDDTMPTYFNFDTATGVISVRQSLLQENRDFYVGRIVAYDAGSPPRSATSTAIINISRNLNQPIFSPQFYNETILETAATNTVILRVTATDADRLVSAVYFLKKDQGSIPELSSEAFRVLSGIMKLHCFSRYSMILNDAKSAVKG